MRPLIVQIYKPSLARDSYLQQLEFLCNPAATFPTDHTIDPQLVIIFGRFDLISEATLWDKLNTGNFLKYVVNSITFVENCPLWANFMPGPLLKLALLNGELFEMAGMLMPGLIEELSPAAVVKRNEMTAYDLSSEILRNTLEYFRATANVENAQNAICLPKLKAKLVSDENGVLTFQAGEKLFKFLANAYERVWLKQQGFAITLNDIEDPLPARVAKLLSYL